MQQEAPVDLIEMLGSRTLSPLQRWLKNKPEASQKTELLLQAVRRGAVHAVNLLVRFGALADYRLIHQHLFDSKEKTLFESAVLSQNNQMLDLVNQHDCALHARPRAEMVRAIQCAARVGGRGMLERLCSAAECMGIKWQPVDMRDFFLAAVQPLPNPYGHDGRWDAPAVMRFFTQRYPNSFDASVYPMPTFIAVKLGHWDAAEHLLGECGAKPDHAYEGGATLLMLAAKMGHVNMFSLLRFHDVSPHATDNNGNSVLHYAVQGESAEIVLRLALHCRVDVSLKNTAGQSAYDIAVYRGKEEFVRNIRVSPMFDSGN